MNKYNRRIKIKRDNTLEQEKVICRALVLLSLILVVVLGFWWVNTINARDEQVLRNYEQECGQDVECLKDVYYKYN